MQPADKPALIRLLRATPEFKPSEIAVAEEVIDACLKDPAGSGYYILVAAEGKTVVGYIGYGPTPLTESTWDMYWEAVALANRGQGIGGALMAAAEENIAAAGGKQVLIETSGQASYEATLRFHLGNGYLEVGRIPDFYAPGDAKIILRKLLL
jgi:ribosomal protein S18 acetylase RimI-like enzyme